MQPDDFRKWRKALAWKQKDAADRLGLKKRVIQYYEKGDRDGKPVEIPLTVELACLALSLGYEGYDGGPVSRANGASSTAQPDAAPDEAIAESAPEAPEAPVPVPAKRPRAAKKEAAAPAAKRKPASRAPKADAEA